MPKPKSLRQRTRRNMKNSNGNKLAPSLSIADDDKNRKGTTLFKRVDYLLVFIHLAGLYGAYLWFTHQIMWQTIIWSWFFGYVVSGAGIIPSSTKYWDYRLYKPKLARRLLLAFMQTAAFERSIYDWCGYYRGYNTRTNISKTQNKGRLNSHSNSTRSRLKALIVHFKSCFILDEESFEDVNDNGIDLSDLEADRVVMLQKKYFIALGLVISFLIPTVVPIVFWRERLSPAFFFAAQFRFVVIKYSIWFVRRVTHLMGSLTLQQIMVVSHDY